MAQLNSAEAMIKALEARVAQLEKALQVTASQIVLQAGSAKITLTSVGNIQITSGLNTQITSGADMQMKAAGNMVMKANRIVQN
jgi:uncharacterized protein (DUF2345 family)